MPVTKRVSPGETLSTTDHDMHLTDKEEGKPVVDVRIMRATDSTVWPCVAPDQMR
jgi:hypothetical protein